MPQPSSLRDSVLGRCPAATAHAQLATLRDDDGCSDLLLVLLLGL
jgi:hypothetical protein